MTKSFVSLMLKLCNRLQKTKDCLSYFFIKLSFFLYRLFFIVKANYKNHLKKTTLNNILDEHNNSLIPVK